MTKKRTTVMVDMDALSRVEKISQAGSQSAAIDIALREYLRRDSVRKMAEALGAAEAPAANDVKGGKR